MLALFRFAWTNQTGWPAYAGLCRLHQGSLGCDSQLSRGNDSWPGDEFGIIRKSGLWSEFSLCGWMSEDLVRPKRARYIVPRNGTMNPVRDAEKRLAGRGFQGTEGDCAHDQHGSDDDDP
jgi:hypothetical protein